MSIDTTRCIGLDFETTGINAHEDRVVQAALVDLAPQRRPGVATWLVNPGVPIPAEASEVHHITDAIVQADGLDPADVLFDLTGRLALALGRGIPVVGFNISYDLTMLEAENRRHGLPTLTERLTPGQVAPIVDVHVLDKYADKYRKGGRKLVDVAAHYRVINVGAHDAAGDALASCRLWPRVMDAHAEKFRGLNLAGLHAAQVKWRAEQMNGLRAYFDKNQIEHDGCDRGWPIQRTPAVTR